MQKRKFDELISHFNRKVSDMSIDQKYKMELLGMISAIGFAHEKEHGTNLAEVGTDLISRATAQTELQLSARRYTVAHEAHGEGRVVWSEDLISVSDAMDVLRKIPSTQPTFDARDTQYNLPIGTDCISRQAAINAIDECYCGGEDSCGEPWIYKENAVEAIQMIEPIPSAQPQRTCVNCGRTVNNGGRYADGGTRCPIEEHYALPKDGYCHLWEKRNVTDDDYPERREE